MYLMVSTPHVCMLLLEQTDEPHGGSVSLASGCDGPEPRARLARPLDRPEDRSMGRPSSPISRRAFVAGAAAAAVAAPWVVRAAGPLTLKFRTIPDPDG